MFILNKREVNELIEKIAEKRAKQFTVDMKPVDIINAIDLYESQKSIEMSNLKKEVKSISDAINYL